MKIIWTINLAEKVYFVCNPSDIIENALVFFAIAVTEIYWLITSVVPFMITESVILTIDMK